MQNPTTFIYIIAEEGTQFVKIGISRNPQQRLYGLQTANPRKLQILATWEGDESAEASFHYMLADFRREGEWFHLPDCILQNLLKQQHRAVWPRPRYDAGVINGLSQLGQIAIAQLTMLRQKPNKSNAHGRRSWLERHELILRDGNGADQTIANEIRVTLATLYNSAA